MLSLVAPAEIGVFYVVVLALNGLVNIVTQPHTMGNCAAGKTEMEGRVGFMGGTLIKRICTVPWALTGVAAVVYFAGQSMAPDSVFGSVAGDFLPGLLPGLLGVFIAAVLASVMSSCDVFMVSSSALFTEDIYKRYNPRAPAGHYILVGRIAAVAVVTGGIAFAYWLPDVVKGLEIFWKIPAMMGIAFWLGLFWRRMNAAGAWASTLTAFGIWWLTTQTFFVDLMASIPGSDSWRILFESKDGLEIYQPWQMIFYLAGGAGAGIVVSLLTRPVAQEKLDLFYALVRTPVRAGEKVDGPCTLPRDAKVPPRRSLVPGKQFEIPVPSLVSIAGFLVGWCFVAALIFVVYRIAS
jgi:Na+/proline symporter